MTPVSKFGLNVRTQLNRIGRTQRWLALTVEMSPQSMSQMLRSHRPLRKTVRKLAVAIGCKPSKLAPWMFLGVDDRGRSDEVVAREDQARENSD